MERIEDIMDKFTKDILNLENTTLENIGAWHCEKGHEPVSDDGDYLEGYRKQYAKEQMESNDYELSINRKIL